MVPTLEVPTLCIRPRRAMAEGIKRQTLSTSHTPDRGRTVRDPRQGLVERAVTGVLWTSLASGAQALLQLAALVLLARLLSPGEFGVFAAALVVVGLSSIFSQLGVGP